MTIVLHPVCEEFRIDAARLVAMKANDPALARRIDAYHQIGRALHRAACEGGREAAELRAARQDLRREIARRIVLFGSVQEPRDRSAEVREGQTCLAGARQSRTGKPLILTSRAPDD